MLCTLLAGLSLSLAAPVPRPRAPDLFPLAKGARWDYQASASLGGDMALTSAAAVEVVASETKGGTTVATLVMRTKVGEEAQEQTLEVSSDADGVYARKASGLTMDKPVPLLKYPATPGATWSVTDTSAGVEVKATYTVKASQRVRVPAGVYDKAVPVVGTAEFEVGGKKEKLTSATWYVDGVGMVKAEVESDSFRTTMELTKYTPAK